MVILRATSILGGQKEDKGMMCSITHLLLMTYEFDSRMNMGSSSLVVYLEVRL
jgi:hypothetical protein